MRQWTVLGLIAYSGFIAWVLLSPSAALPSTVVLHVSELLGAAGAPPGLTLGNRVEFALNALMVVPIAAGGSVLMPTTTWRDWTSWAFVASGGVELIQGVWLSERSAAFVDICANTAGALLGAAGVSLVRLLCRSPGGDEAQSAP